MSPDADSSAGSRQRHPAVKVPLRFVLTAQVMEQPDGPSYLALGEKKVYRVNVLAVVVDAQNDRTFSVDDGTGKIGVRGFEALPKVAVGDLVLLIARPRAYGSDRYLVPEIVAPTTETWMRVRKKELEGLALPEPAVIEESVLKEEIIERPHEKILAFIRSQDSGAGVAVETIMNETGATEETVQLLLKEGEVFEITPGRYKVLE
ncbi:hypothetical protein J4419_05830 [Candidatus Woesearchaeota archaeon]|nr:hypothetical protein [Candidatus Woesearchaeota archaeon]